MGKRKNTLPYALIICELPKKNLKGLQAQAVFAAEHSIAFASFLTELKTAHI